MLHPFAYVQVTKELQKYCTLFDPPVSFSQYSELMKRIYKVLIDPYDESDALMCTEEDWVRDKQGEEGGGADRSARLGRGAYMDSLFELADHVRAHSFLFLNLAIPAARSPIARINVSSHVSFALRSLRTTSQWTQGVSAEEYAEFLRFLLRAVSIPAADTGGGAGGGGSGGGGGLTGR